jgi:hypothetical protein
LVVIPVVGGGVVLVVGGGVVDVVGGGVVELVGGIVVMVVEVVGGWLVVVTGGVVDGFEVLAAGLEQEPKKIIRAVDAIAAALRNFPILSSSLKRSFIEEYKSRALKLL